MRSGFRFWKLGNEIKKELVPVEEFAAQIGRIDERAFCAKAQPVVSKNAGLTPSTTGTLAGCSRHALAAAFVLAAIVLSLARTSWALPRR